MIRFQRFPMMAAAFLVFVLANVHFSIADEPPWEPLFDGKTLNGWTKRGGEATYRAADGCVVGTTKPNTPNTFLCTDREFTDFVLEYEFKIDPRLNSGVQIRSNSVSGYQNGRVHGYQVEIDPTDRAYTAGIYDEARREWLAKPKDVDAVRKAYKPNDWNQVRVEARGDLFKTWLNGVPVAELKDSLTRTGFIGLQVHGTDSQEPLEVRWRNIRIQDFGDPWRKPPAEATVLLGDNGDLSQWEHAGKAGSKIEWLWKKEEGAPAGGYLEVKPGSGDIATKKTFGDFRLHVEFNVDDNGKEGQANGNSGVYIQNRYEVQILNSAGQAPADDICGGIYKVKAADSNMARAARQWQTYDIVFRAPRWSAEGKKTENARITVYHNGTRIHDNVEIPDKTGGGQAEGPTDDALRLQDHGNLIRFRNVWIAPLKQW